ncbi:MAG: DNA cytosine methyltransferase [Candidatus Hodarchaeales archaeon]
MKDQIVAVDLFAGCGGFSHGMERAGVKIITANEIWEPAYNTYSENHSNTVVIPGDIQDKNIKTKLKNSIPNNGRKIDVVFGGPPCQGFSISGNRNPLDSRAHLYKEFIDFVRLTQPKVFLMENVKGILSTKHIDPKARKTKKQRTKYLSTKLMRYKDLKRFASQRGLSKTEEKEYENLKTSVSKIKKQLKEQLVPVKDLILRDFKRIGYKTKIFTLNAADYSVPQLRERVFFLGSKVIDVKSVKAPTKVITDPSSYKTTREALEDLERSVESDKQFHVFTKHSEKFIEKMKNTPQGDSVYKNYKDAFFRLLPDKPARTVKENHGGVFVHYKYDRVLTPRELARLQGFPDEFHFLGTKSDVLKQIGNAVPVPLAEAWGKHLATIFNQI